MSGNLMRFVMFGQFPPSDPDNRNEPTRDTYTMSKEMFIDAHMELQQKYMEDHPEASEDEAYDKTADAAYDRMVDKMADLGDRLKDEMKEKGMWRP